MKGIIYFSDISLFNDCEIAARQNNMKKAQDFIIFACEKLMQNKYPEKKIKKPLDLWLIMDQFRKTQYPSLSMGGLIEKICQDEIHPVESPQKGIFQKIGDAISLPRS